MSEFQIDASKYREKMSRISASEELKDYLRGIAENTQFQDVRHGYRKMNFTRRFAMTVCLAFLGILFLGGTVYAVMQKNLLGRFFYVVDEVDMDEILIQKDVVYDVGNHLFTLEGVAYNEMTRAGCLTVFVQNKDGSEPTSFRSFSCKDIIVNNMNEYYPEETFCWKISGDIGGNQFSLSRLSHDILRQGIQIDNDVIYLALYPFEGCLTQFVKEDGGVRFYLDFQISDLSHVNREKEAWSKYNIEVNSLDIYELLGSGLRFHIFTDEEWKSLTEKTNQCATAQEFCEIWEAAGFAPVECKQIVTQVFADERLQVLVGQTNVRVCFNVENTARKDIKNICIIKNDGTRIVIMENGEPMQSRSEVSGTTYSSDKTGIISFAYHLGEVLPDRENVRVEVDGEVLK